MDFSKRVIQLIENKNITKNKLLIELGLSKNSFVVWGKGAMPNSDAVIRIAEYFNVSTDYLLGKTDDPSPTSDKEYTEIEKDLVTNYRKLDDEGKIKLDGYLEDLVRLHNLNIQKINDKHKALTLDNTKIEESDIEFIEKLVELKEKE